MSHIVKYNSQNLLCSDSNKLDANFKGKQVLSFDSYVQYLKEARKCGFIRQRINEDLLALNYTIYLYHHARPSIVSESINVTEITNILKEEENSLEEKVNKSALERFK